MDSCKNLKIWWDLKSGPCRKFQVAQISSLDQPRKINENVFWEFKGQPKSRKSDSLGLQFSTPNRIFLQG